MTRSNQYQILWLALTLAVTALFSVACQSTYEYKGVLIEPPLQVVQRQLQQVDHLVDPRFVDDHGRRNQHVVAPEPVD